jgi:tetratricopeptide (TPR) repeat protein
VIEIMTEDATKREGPTPARAAHSKDEPAYLDRGTLVGRYVVLDRLGEGGMGVVYRAFDPELDRKVAIKLLQAGDGSESSAGGQAWLLREAQALARLSHPNVVAVHDVGTLAGDQVFVAMELVDGVTLRAWMRQKQRTWREVRDVALAAGAGLAAAHKAGLVHRDVKPENVLVGADGRVRVMDFGLARLHAADGGAPRDSDREISARSPLSDALTMAGSVVGTPAYMAPEIYQGEAADARGDQFGFGVTLFEALYGARPYDKSELANPTGAKPRLTAGAKVPARLERLVLRAIEIDPALRFASMDDLLAELAIDPMARRRRLAIGAAGIAAIAVIVAGATVLARGDSQVCKGADKKLAGVWDDATKQKVRAAYVASKLPYAATAYAALATAVDRYAASWVAASTDSCEATRVRKDQTEDVLSLRQTCLDERLGELGALTRLLAEPNPVLIAKADKIVSELEPISRCANVAMLKDPKQPPPEMMPQVREMQAKLADVKALVIAGRYLELLNKAREVEKIAQKLDWKPVEAQVLLLRGMALGASQNYEDSAKAFADAVWAAEAARRDDIVANAAVTVAQITAEGAGKIDEAKIWLALGKAASQRMGADRFFDWRIAETEGLVEALAGNVMPAIAAHTKALEQSKALWGSESPIVWEDEQLLATTLTKASRWTEAAPHYEHALALRISSVGEMHQDTALIMSNLAACYSYAHDPRWRPMFDKALAMRQKLFGKDSPVVAPTLNNYADALARVGEYDAALPLADRATAIAASLPGKDHFMYHQIATDRAEILTFMGRYADAHAVFDEVLPIEERVKSSILPMTQVVRAELALAEHQWADAAAWADKSIAGFQVVGGKENPELWRPYAALGRAQVGLGKKDDARANLEHALAMAKQVQIDIVQVAAAREALKRL